MKPASTAPRFPVANESDTHPLETLALWLLAALAGLGAVHWITGELSGRLSGGSWPHVTATEMGRVPAAVPHHVGDPGEAWPVGARTLIPGPVGF